MDVIERQRHLNRVTRMLVLLTGIGLGVIAIALYKLVAQAEQPERTYLMLYVFAAGLMGGFVSLQQRLPGLTLTELRELSQSWFTVLMVPINGGVFAIVLHLMFTAGLLEGAMFPKMAQPTFDQAEVVGSFYNWLVNTMPATGPDVAKLLFWSFVAGFSERFVPQIIKRTADSVEESQGRPAAPGKGGAAGGAGQAAGGQPAPGADREDAAAEPGKPEQPPAGEGAAASDAAAGDPPRRE